MTLRLHSLIRLVRTGGTTDHESAAATRVMLGAADAPGIEPILIART